MLTLFNLKFVLLFYHFSFPATSIPSSTEYVPQSNQLAHVPASTQRPLLSLWSTAKAVVVGSIGSWLKSGASESPGLEPTQSIPTTRFYAQYSDQLVLRFNISSETELRSVAEACDILYLDVWGQSQNWVDIRLPYSIVPSLLGLLPPTLQHAHVPLMSSRDLARSIADTYPGSQYSPSRKQSRRPSRTHLLYNKTSKKGGDSAAFFEDYRSLQDINTWTGLLSSTYPSIVQKIVVGSSYEMRDIPALRIGTNSSRDPNSPLKRRTIIISGGLHAREWISTSTVSYVAYSFASSYGQDPLITTLIDSLDFILIPTLNPDGYEYTWSTDRLWRKNRQKTTLPFCNGVDLDRNWGYMWDGNRTIDNPCSESYAGQAQFDAPESSSFAEWIKNETEANGAEIVGLIDLHSYSQQILYPYSFSCSAEPPSLENLQELGHGLAKSIRIASRQKYKVLPACEGNVAASGRVLPQLDGGGGSLLDWFYQALGVRKSFQIKLRDKGAYGFLLPAEEIIPTGDEIFSLVVHFAKLQTVSNESLTEVVKVLSPLQHLLKDQNSDI